MTPERAIALCGEPILDETQTHMGEVTRRLIIRNYYALAMELDFAAALEPEKWRLDAVQIRRPRSRMRLLPAKSAFCRVWIRKKNRVAGEKP